MIYNGKNGGYVSGNLNQPVNTVLASMKGPIQGRNWYATSINPAYNITITSGATGAVKLQGTNDVAVRQGFDDCSVATDLLPTDNASWSDIQGATSTTVSGTFSTAYQFLLLIISTQGTGYVTRAWVKWN